ncbi:hypothetical protein [Azospirillum brasilense]|uniref:Lipocalin-like domain-containing protein n=1 Tax=Azospirillum brasilense TaxID=192 RepID=A0A235HA02_AZOBR|nr:hypothetical protein [Azospirillum brasilense]OYD82586.1 hypothetical protein CHT98_20570 [Azospirillum brasilense]
MDDGIGQQDLIGNWVHVSEEDTAEGKVYRPSTFPLPSKGGRGGPAREEIRLMPDNTVEVRTIGPADPERTSRGRWRLEGGDRLAISFTEDPPETVSFQILSVQPDRLVLKK